MSGDIRKERLDRLIDELKSSVTREECWDCECFQGFLTRLELDFKEEPPFEELEKLKVGSKEMHSCLDCQPCGPAEVFYRYLRAARESNPAR